MIYLPNSTYDPNNLEEINSKTKLARGITIGKFLGGYGDRHTLDHIQDLPTRKQIARNLYLHAQAMLFVDNNRGEFEDYRLIVAEGFYKPGPEEVLAADSINYLMTRGRAVVYELVNDRGVPQPEKTFDLCAEMKDFVQFEKLILDYDTYNPDGSLNAQIILIMPSVPVTWEVTFNKNLETRFNNYVQGTNELIEVLES